MIPSPYVIGQWVRGPRFYGRRQLRDQILNRPERAVWVAGLRRVGKTSLLRQLELELGERGDRALFLDLQGVDGAGELDRALEESWLESPAATLPPIPPMPPMPPMPPPSPTPPTPPPEITAVAAELAGENRRFWLLVDEVDELGTAGPEVVEAFTRLLAGIQTSPNVNVVLCSSPRLAERRSALPLLVPFGSPRLLGAMPPEEARELVEQVQAPPLVRPHLPPPLVTAICETCGGHPMLLQLVAKRSLEGGDVESAIRELERDRSLEYLFAVDHDLLTPRERELLEAASLDAGIGHGGGSGSETRRLVELGVLTPQGSIPNRLLTHWLRRRVAATR